MSDSNDNTPETRTASPLAELRRQIDALDDELVRLLHQRAAVVKEVGDHKRAAGLPFYVPGRERAIVDRLVNKFDGGFPAAAIGTVFQEIISACLSLEQRQSVAYLGPEGTFTHQAVVQRFGSAAQALPCGTIDGVMSAVARGTAHYGLVPIENSSEGMVAHTLDSFVGHDVAIIGEVLLAVEHALLAGRGVAIEAIERVYSHPQALGQCRTWLQQNLPNAALIEAASTADAARTCRTDRLGAAVGAERAGRLHDLVVLRPSIQDQADNATRFLVIAAGEDTSDFNAHPSGEHIKTTVLLTLKDTPGALYNALLPLKEAGINLSKIQSRPSPVEKWAYLFFLDFAGHRSAEPVAKALSAMQRHCAELRVLGSYPAADGPAADGGASGQRPASLRPGG